VADAVADLAGKVFGREAEWGVGAHALDSTREYVAPTATRVPRPSLATTGPRHLGDDFEMVQDTFRRFADEKLKPIAEHIHRHNGDIPEDIITGLAEMGAFGLSIPEEYGGFASGGDADYIGMVVATEELSRGSLGAGGSLITRPEILARALEAGGTEEQKHEWLPKLATAEVMNAVAVTEPDYGSDVAGVKVTATPADRGRHRRLRDQRREDVVHVRRPRRRADAARPHRPRPLARATGACRCSSCPSCAATATASWSPGRHGRRPGGGKMEGRPIDTIGYRGMHSYEVALEDWFVPGRQPDRRSTAARAAASTTRWPGSRTAACRPPPGPSV
jgi:(2S)-methylsuccinyl-CoA dehydrogenase